MPSSDAEENNTTVLNIDSKKETDVLTRSNEKVCLQNDVNIMPKIPFPSCQFVLSVLIFLGTFVLYCLRVNLSVAMVAMVNSTYNKELESEDFNNTDTGLVDDFCGTENYNNTQTNKDTGSFNWDSKQQGSLLAAFFYGYIVTQIPGGTLAQKFGGKVLLLFGISWASVFTIVTPPLIYVGDYAALIAVRVLEGIGAGVSFPTIHYMIAQWAPPLERSRMVGLSMAGAQLGTVITMPVSGLLYEYVSWESIFYVFGVVGMIWSVFWVFLIYDSPHVHPRISAVERDYISQGSKVQSKGSLKVPWLEIMKSLPVYATTVANFTSNWGFYTLLTCLPQYLKHILKFDIKSNGFVSGLPYLVLWGMLIFIGFFVDWIRKRNFLSNTNVRKIFTATGFLGSAITLVATGYVDCNAGLAVFLIVMSVAMCGVSSGGWNSNHLDLAPQYAGTLMGITNTVGTIPGFLGPMVVGSLTYKNQTRMAWQEVFFIAGGIYVFGAIFFVIFASGERQKWAEDPETDITKKVELTFVGNLDDTEKSNTKMVLLKNGSLQDTKN